MYPKYCRTVFVLIGLLLVITGVWSVEAQDTSNIPQVMIEVSADGPEVPQEIPAGIVHITFENQAETPFSPIIARLNDGVSFDDVTAARDQGGKKAVLGLVSMMGYLQVLPGAEGNLTFDFAPGTYLLASDTMDPNQELPIFSFTVTTAASEDIAAPVADVEVSLVNFAFNMPISIPSGPQMWHIENKGDQLHEMVVVRLPDDTTVARFDELLMHWFVGQERELAVPVIYWIASPGEQGWVTYDLQPGTYGVFCGQPDASGSGHLHAELGMRQTFTVSD